MQVLQELILSPSVLDFLPSKHNSNHVFHPPEKHQKEKVDTCNNPKPQNRKIPGRIPNTPKFST